MTRFHTPIRIVLIAAAGLLAAGCTMTPGPGTGVDYRQGGGSGRSLPSSGTYTVQRNDTIYGIARQFGVSVRALIDANNLQPPYQLTTGQVLFLSTGREYTVVKGDSLLVIARKTGVSYSTLARMNNITDPNMIRVGQRLKLPSGANAPIAMADAGGGRGGPSAVTSQPLPPPQGKGRGAAGQPVPPPPPPGMQPPGAQQQQGNPPQAAGAVPPPPPGKGKGKDKSKKGGYMTLADREKAAAAAAPQSAPADAPPPGVSPDDAAAPPPAAPVAAPPPAVAAPAAATGASAAATAMQTPPPKSGRGFTWPVRGEVINEFGSSGKGVHNDGINIAVPKGTPVIAAEDGVVAYSGNELRGFGNLLLIKHADNWMTAYAHNDQLLVRKGELVKRGQRIALSGDSGGVSQPQLHFELRQGTRAVDPQTMFKD